MRLHKLRSEVHDLLIPTVVGVESVGEEPGNVSVVHQRQLLVWRPIGLSTHSVGKAEQDHAAHEHSAYDSARPPVRPEHHHAERTRDQDPHQRRLAQKTQCREGPDSRQTSQHVHAIGRDSVPRILERPTHELPARHKHQCDFRKQRHHKQHGQKHARPIRGRGRNSPNVNLGTRPQQAR